eukprot:8224016-Lingulodinium_polyedra.AAC.1
MWPQVGVVDCLSDEASEGGWGNLVDLVRQPVGSWGAAARFQDEAHGGAPPRPRAGDGGLPLLEVPIQQWRARRGRLRARAPDGLAALPE